MSRGDRWLQKYLLVTGQDAPPLEEDQGGGFKGIGGGTKTAGARQLQLCLELASGGLAHGDLRSVELVDSSAPLLLSLEAQRRLGLVLDLNRDVAYSQTLDQELRLVHYNGIFGIRLLPGNFAGLAESPKKDDVKEYDIALSEDQGELSDEVPAIGYLSYDEMLPQVLSKGQTSTLRNHIDGISGRDKVLWNQLCKRKVHRRVCLPRGCKTFLLEIFAGCAMLTSLAHYSYGLPVSQPIDLKYDNNLDLTTPAGRVLADQVIERDDPYLITFAPKCAPWSAWQHVNMSKGGSIESGILQERKKWVPIIRWICGHVKDRLRRGRHALVENPAGSGLWSVWDMERLLHDWDARHATSGEILEKINTDLCAYNLRDADTDGLHKKRTGLATASRALKDEIYYHGQCTKDHRHEPLEGGTKTRRAEKWTPEFCYAILDSYLKEVDTEMTRQAFPAEASTEGEPYEPTDGPRASSTFDIIHDNKDMASNTASGIDIAETGIREDENQHDESEALESDVLRKSREEWRKLPEATRIAVRRLHTMTGHSSVPAMQRILRTSGADPEVIRALRHFRCPACAAKAKPLRPPSTRSPNDYTFNTEVSIDCFEVKDAGQNRFTIFSVVDMGTLFHAAKVVSHVGGTPTSRTCAEALRRIWLNWPRAIVMDRGPHNRGIFLEQLQHHGVEVRFTGVEAAYQLGRGERQGGILKQMIQHVVESRQVIGAHLMELMLPEVVYMKNNRIHHGGFTPSQWVLGKLPLQVDSLTSEDAHRYLGVHQDIDNGESAFARQLQLRQAAKEAFSFVDSSQRVRSAMLRKSDP